MSPEEREHLELQLSAYLDGELSAAEREALEATLAGDDAARRLLAELRATVEAVRKLSRARAGDGLMDAVRSRLERQALLENRPPVPIAPQRSSRAGNWLAAAAMISLSVLTGYTLWPLLAPEPTRPNPQFAMQKQVAPQLGREARELARDAVGRAPVADESIASGDHVASPPPREGAGIRPGDVDNADREQFGVTRALAAREGKAAGTDSFEAAPGEAIERVPTAKGGAAAVAGLPKAEHPVLAVELAYADSDQRRAAVDHLKRAYESVSQGEERSTNEYSLGVQWEESVETDGDLATRGVAAEATATDGLTLVVPDGRTALELADAVETSTNALGYRVLDTWDFRAAPSSKPHAARGRLGESRHFGALAATPQPQRPETPRAPNQPVTLGTTAADVAGTAVRGTTGSEVLRLYFYAGDARAAASRPATTRPAGAATTRPVQTSSAP